MGKATIRAKQKDYNNSIGDRLCRRIAEMGYTQEQFCELSGVPKSTLTKHMNNSISYRIDTLMKYAEVLDCSYDYLLGYSKSPKREYHDVVEQTGLSIEAIENLTFCVKHIDNSMAKDMLDIVSSLICHKSFVRDLRDYLGMNKQMLDVTNKMVDMTFSKVPDSLGIKYEELKKSEVELPLLICVMNDLAELKHDYTNQELCKEISAELDKLK